ncbi:hypothetical protein BJX68DRAFT_240676 [Aspergillus pseudodeflectus]|uniref:Uncharacterized protein n=1 Tax=Aspergillus pseudodeflectus TaxID=176178 RepID=A0ABR4K5P5_9EURO
MTSSETGTPPLAEVGGGPWGQSSRTTANRSPVTRPSSPGLLLDQIQGTPQAKIIPSIEPASPDSSASHNPEASDRQVTDPSEAAEEQLQVLQHDSVRTANDAHESNTPTGPSTTLRRRHTQQTPSSQERHDRADGGSNNPSIASKAWAFFVQKLVPVSAVLGLILVFAFGIGAWVGMNYANSYSKKQYDIALFGACHDYEDIRKTEFCEKVINAGIAPSALVKRQENAPTEEPAYVARFLNSIFAVGKLLFQALFEAGSRTFAEPARRLQERPMYFVFWTLPMSTQNCRDCLLDSHSLGYVVLESWRTILFLGWQTILFGCSRFCLLACILHMVEWVPHPLYHSSLLRDILAASAVSVLLFDAFYISFSLAWARWATALASLLSFCFAATAAWARELANIASIPPMLTAAGMIWLMIVFIPCWIIHAARVGVLCLCSFGTFALWRGWEVNKWNVVKSLRRWGGWGLAGMVLVLLGALLDFFHPNIITSSFYGAWCS